VPDRFDAVVYDYGGVFSPSPFGAIRAYEAELGVEEGAVARLLFGTSYAHGESDGEPEHDWHKLETGRLSMQEWYEGVVARAGDVLGSDVELDLGRAFSGGGMVVHWEMVHHVRRVRAGGHRVAILTNNIREYGDHWRSSIPVDELVDVVVDSSHEGIRKPDEEIYRRTADRLGVAVERCVFLDDLDANVEGARRAGMHGVLVDDVVAAVVEVEETLGLDVPRARRTSPAPRR
jgi:putative hydrolase of the HAD superfamily